MITPKDIPNSVVRKILLDDTYENVVAAILNAAISEGLVVPASEAKVLRRALALLRTIRSEGYTPGGDGSLAIEQRIKGLESLER